MRLTLGLLPAAGGSLSALRATGQESRLLHSYFPAYLQQFDRLLYFSNTSETLESYSDDRVLKDGVLIESPSIDINYRLYAFAAPLLKRQAFRECALLRVFQATGAIPAVIARQIYGIPFVTTYGYKYHEFARIEKCPLKSLYLRAIEWMALNAADAVIVTTSELARFVGKFTSASKVILNPNGVDTELFAPKTPLSKPREHGGKKIVYVGRLTHQKNLFRLLETIKKVQNQQPVILDIIGQGALAGDLQHRAANLKLAVKFWGTVPHQKLPAMLNAADLFVLPSLIEGHPKALLEAMSCGLPCAVSNCDGNRTVIMPGETGLLFDPRDVSGMASQLARLLNDRSYAIALGKAARRHILSKYDLKTLLDREANLLREVATSRRAQSFII